MNERLYSIDALRGATMIFIVGLAPLVATICNLIPGDISSAIALQMEHVDWDGLRHHDTLFPTFLFIAGMTFPFSYLKQLERGKSTSDIYRKIFTRAIVLVCLGLIYNGLFRLDFANLRFASVLGRIGIAWMFSAILFINFKVTSRIIIAVSVLVLYWVLSAFVTVPGIDPGVSPFSMEGCLAGYIDRMILPGRFYQEIFDPEGIFSTIPAIVTAMLGMFTGEFIMNNKLSGNKKSLYMTIAGIILIIAGFLWDIIYPINKALWSSSFVLAVGGISLVLTALFYYLIDVKGWKKWAFCFEVIGLNSITVYLATAIFDFSSISRFFFRGLAGLFDRSIGAVVLAGGYLLVVWLFTYFLYKQKIFIKI